MTANGVLPLPIGQTHALRSAALPLHHRDPFDRMLVAQAQVEGLRLMTADPLMRQYEVDLIAASEGAEV
jgi:PIN domain nuclease of toxin-antitoxin system